MTVDELREALAEFPGYYPVTIAVPDDDEHNEDGELLEDIVRVTTEGMSSVQVVIR